MKSLLLFAALSVGCAEFKCGSYMDDGDAVDGPMCYHYLERTMSVSGSFSPLKRSLIRDAGKMWSDATNGIVKLTFVDHVDNNTDIYQVPMLDDGNWGRENQADGGMKISSNVPDEYFAATIAHELAHTFGLGHSYNPANLMFYNAHDDMYITSEDVDHFYAVARNGVYK